MNVTASVLIRAAVRVGDTCSEDEAFRRATKCWSGSFRFGVDDQSVRFTFDAGDLVSVTEIKGKAEDAQGEFGFEGSCVTWESVLMNSKVQGDFSMAVDCGEELDRTGDRAVYWLYYPAARRFFELLSETLDSQS